MEKSKKPLYWGPEEYEMIEEYEKAKAEGRVKMIDMTQELDKLEQKLEQDKLEKKYLLT